MLNIAKRSDKNIIIISAVFLLAVTGCVSPDIKWTAIPDDTDALLEVPDYIQERNQCGPFALAAVINYWHERGLIGASISAEEISREIYSRSAKGVLGMDLYGYANKLDLFARQFNGTAISLRKAIKRQEPVIVLVDYGKGSFQINHFMVVSGYSSKGFVVHSGSGFKHISDAELQRVWARAGHWALTVRPFLPEERIQRGLDFERRGQLKAALNQYELVREKYPIVYLYLGNIYYQLKNFQRAEIEYKKAIELTGDANAFNNLAWLYYELDTNLDMAFKLAEKATELVTDSKIYIDTLDKIRERLCTSSDTHVACTTNEHR
jgi:tetratricopeptide (TPR) repeat protein